MNISHSCQLWQNLFCKNVPTFCQLGTPFQKISQFFLNTWSFLDRILLFVSSKIILHSCVNNHSMAKEVCWTFFHEIWAVDTEFLDIKMSHLRRGSSPVFNGFLLWLSDSQHLNPPWKIFILREKIRRHFIHFQLASGFYN